MKEYFSHFNKKTIKLASKAYEKFLEQEEKEEKEAKE